MPRRQYSASSASLLVGALGAPLLPVGPSDLQSQTALLACRLGLPPLPCLERPRLSYSVLVSLVYTETHGPNGGWSWWSPSPLFAQCPSFPLWFLHLDSAPPYFCIVGNSYSNCRLILLFVVNSSPSITCPITTASSSRSHFSIPLHLIIFTYACMYACVYVYLCMYVLQIIYIYIYHIWRYRCTQISYASLTTLNTMEHLQCYFSRS